MAKHYTEDTEAYEAYIKGRYFWNKRTPEGIKKGISCFEDAIIKDPNYALAYAGLADSYATMIIFDEGRPDEIMRQAQSAALRALEIDDELAEAHASLGYVKHRFEWDWPGAERGIQARHRTQSQLRNRASMVWLVSGECRLL